MADPSRAEHQLIDNLTERSTARSLERPLAASGPPPSGYPLTADLVAESDDESLTTLTSGQQDDLRNSAITEIERWCNQSFTQEGTELSPVTKVVDSPGGDELWVPRRLVELTDAKVTGSYLAVGDFAVDEDHARVYIVPPSIGGWLLQAQAKITGAMPRELPVGKGMIALTGVWGWLDTEWTNWQTDGVLAPVARAIRYEMEENAQVLSSALATTVAAARRLGLKNVNEGGVNISLGAEQSIGARARRELVDFIWEGNLAAAV